MKDTASATGTGRFSRLRRGGWAGKGIGHAIEIIGHLQVGIIDHIVAAIGLPVAHGGEAGGRQIVGVNVVGEHIIGGEPAPAGLLQTFQRQAVGGVDTGRAQDGKRTPLRRPRRAGSFGIDTTAGARAFRFRRRVSSICGAATIAVNPGGANVNQAAW
jgi:hypothetical protein